MRHDFLYCPRCVRYSIFRWVRGQGQWECEDCSYRPPREDALEPAAADSDPALAKT
jgi:ribosomal protein L37AE/L43A